MCGHERYGPVTDIYSLVMLTSCKLSVLYMATTHWELKIFQNYGPIFELLRSKHLVYLEKYRHQIWAQLNGIF